MQRMTSRGLRWLSRAADDPQACRDRWDLFPCAPQLLPVGRLFDLVTVPAPVGRRVLELLGRGPHAVGAVLLDERVNKVGFLVGPGSRTATRVLVQDAGGSMEGVRSLGRGSYVLVPGPEPHARASQSWLLAPGVRETNLTSLDGLALMLARLGHAERRTLAAAATPYGNG